MLYVQKEGDREMTNEEAIKNIRAFAYYVDEPIPEPVVEALDLAIKALEEDRPTGKWIDNQNNSGGGINCSICGEMLPCTDEYWYETDYCPTCGAKMKGEEE